MRRMWLERENTVAGLPHLVGEGEGEQEIDGTGNYLMRKTGHQLLKPA